MSVPEMLTSQGDQEDSVRVIAALQPEVFDLKNRIAGMSQGEIGDKPEEITRWRSVQSMPKFSGDDKVFKDFDFKLHQLVRPVIGFEKFLDWIKDSDVEPDAQKMAEYKYETGYPVEYLNDQLYGLLSMLAEGSALQTVMNVAEAHNVRGVQSWYRMTREASGKTGARLKRLSDKVHRPKQITDYKGALVQLTAWDTSLKELVKVEGQGLSELTKITTLSNMVPEDLMRDIDKDKSLTKFEDIWNYVTEQVEVRKHWSTQKKRDPNAMDVDMAEKEETQENFECQPCDQELDTLKGGGNQVFQGYCGYCNIWGHKRAFCKKRQADLAKGGKGKEGKGKDGKGQEQGKGQWQSQSSWQQAPKGGWQPGGWQIKGGGKGKSGGKHGGKGFGGPGKGFGATMYNIDGDDGSWSNAYGGGWGSSGAVSNGFFGCLIESDDESDGDEELCMITDDDNPEQTSVISTENENSDAHKMFGDFRSSSFKFFGDFLSSQQGRPFEVVSANGETFKFDQAGKEVVSPTISFQRATESPMTCISTCTSSRITSSPTFTALSEFPKAKEEVEKMLVFDLLEYGDDEVIGGDVELPLNGVDEVCDNKDFRPELDAGVLGHKLTEDNLLDPVPVVGVMPENPVDKLIESNLMALKSLFVPVSQECDEGGGSNDSFCSTSDLEVEQESRDVQRARQVSEAFLPEDPDGSNGDSLPLLTKPGLENAINSQDAIRQTPKAKPMKSASIVRRGRWRHKNNLSKLNQRSGEFEKGVPGKEFEKFTIGELKTIVDKSAEIGNLVNESVPQEQSPGLKLERRDEDRHGWMDQELDLSLWDDEEGASSSDLLGFSWRSDPQTW